MNSFEYSKSQENMSIQRNGPSKLHDLSTLSVDSLSKNSIEDPAEFKRDTSLTKSRTIEVVNPALTFEESKLLQITNELILNKKIATKSSASYYRKSDERLESDSESDYVPNPGQQIVINKTFSSKSKEEDEKMPRINPKPNLKDPRFDMRPADRLVRTGETVTFMCRVNGTRPLEVFWYKLNNEDELVNNEKYEIYHDDEHHYLKIYNTEPRDCGM